MVPELRSEFPRFSRLGNLIMKKLLTPIALLIFFSCATNVQDKEVNTKKLRHVVLFKFKETATDADIKTAEEAFSQLPKKIDVIKGFEWGLNNSPEGINKGFTHCFFLTFDDEEGRDIYLPHPAHKAFGELITPFLEDVLVVDYWTP